ncbi:hypothetical protein Tco_1072623 [Tanacetum coccineum]
MIIRRCTLRVGRGCIPGSMVLGLGISGSGWLLWWGEVCGDGVCGNIYGPCDEVVCTTSQMGTSSARFVRNLDGSGEACNGARIPLMCGGVEGVRE